MGDPGISVFPEAHSQLVSCLNQIKWGFSHAPRRGQSLIKSSEPAGVSEIHRSVTPDEQPETRAPWQAQGQDYTSEIHVLEFPGEKLLVQRLLQLGSQPPGSLQTSLPVHKPAVISCGPLALC